MGCRCSRPCSVHDTRAHTAESKLTRAPPAGTKARRHPSLVGRLAGVFSNSVTLATPDTGAIYQIRAEAPRGGPFTCRESARGQRNTSESALLVPPGPARSRSGTALGPGTPRRPPFFAAPPGTVRHQIVAKPIGLRQKLWSPRPWPRSGVVRCSCGLCDDHFWHVRPLTVVVWQPLPARSSKAQHRD